MSQPTVIRTIDINLLATGLVTALVPVWAPASESSFTSSNLTLTCSMVEGFTRAQFAGSLVISDHATADSKEVLASADFDFSTSRKVIEGPDEAPVVREIKEQFAAVNASAVTEYIPAGQLFVHEALAVEVIAENTNGTKTVLRAIPQAPGLNATLLHDGLPYRARCE